MRPTWPLLVVENGNRSVFRVVLSTRQLDCRRAAWFPRFAHFVQLPCTPFSACLFFCACNKAQVQTAVGEHCNN